MDNWHSEYVQLRLPEPDDLSNMMKWENDPTLWHVSDTKVPFSEHTMRQFIESHHDLTANLQLRFMVDLVESGQTVGMVDLFDMDLVHSRVGVGLLVDDAYRQKGIASEALRIAIAYLFDHLHLNQVFCTISRDNQASIAVFEKLGFRSFGYLKEWRKTPSGYEDVLNYQLIKQ